MCFWSINRVKKKTDKNMLNFICSSKKRIISIMKALIVINDNCWFSVYLIVDLFAKLLQFHSFSKGQMVTVRVNTLLYMCLTKYWRNESLQKYIQPIVISWIDIRWVLIFHGVTYISLIRATIGRVTFGPSLLR